jgi:hypothetical protein
MGYMHIDNLYKSQDILAFRWCWALEKVHGTSAHLSYCAGRSPALSYFSGGASHDRFVALFDGVELNVRFQALDHREVMVYGEAYGGKEQGMRATYGDALWFIVFDVKIGDLWLSVPDMDQVATGLGLEVVPYTKVSTDIADLDRERDAPSIVAQRRGTGDDKRREGVVLRPPFEVRKNNGDRIIAKHKLEAFSERATPQKIVDPAKLAVLEQATAIAQEWVTPMRLSHVLDKLDKPHDMTAMPRLIRAMVDDVYREGAGELVESREASAAIGKRTAVLLKARLDAALREGAP